MNKSNNICSIAGKNLQNLRKKHNLTQARLAEKLEISVSHVANIERGESSISLSLLQRIIDLFSITPNDLLLDENIKIEETAEQKLKDIILYHFDSLYFSLCSQMASKDEKLKEGYNEYSIKRSQYGNQVIADIEKK